MVHLHRPHPSPQFSCQRPAPVAPPPLACARLGLAGTRLQELLKASAPDDPDRPALQAALASILEVSQAGPSLFTPSLLSLGGCHPRTASVCKSYKGFVCQNAPSIDPVSTYLYPLAMAAPCRARQLKTSERHTAFVATHMTMRLKVDYVRDLSTSPCLLPRYNVAVPHVRASKVASTINESRGAADNLEQLQAVQARLRDYDGTVISPTRRFIREGLMRTRADLTGDMSARTPTMPLRPVCGAPPGRSIFSFCLAEKGLR